MARLTTDLSARLWSGGICTRWMTIRGFADLSVPPLPSFSERDALTYILKFPRAGHYLTFPAYLGPKGNRVFGNYLTKLHPEYFALLSEQTVPLPRLRGLLLPGF